jgi:putative exporter of polyketide antibiotics
MNTYIIRHVEAVDIESGKSLTWSNPDGWSVDSATIFTEEEMQTFNLPIGGEWVRTDP